jgi:hypothetical protein
MDHSMKSLQLASLQPWMLRWSMQAISFQFKMQSARSPSAVIMSHLSQSYKPLVIVLLILLEKLFLVKVLNTLENNKSI